jgi:hypothetical protein
MCYDQMECFCLVVNVFVPSLFFALLFQNVVYLALCRYFVFERYTWKSFVELFR